MQLGPPVNQRRGRVPGRTPPPWSGCGACASATPAISNPSQRSKTKFEAFTLFRQRPDRDFLEKHDVVVAVILQADIAFEWTRPSLRLKAERLGTHGLTFGVIRYFDAIQKDDGMRTVQRDLHRVPLGAGFAGPGQSFGLRI